MRRVSWAGEQGILDIEGAPSPRDSESTTRLTWDGSSPPHMEPGSNNRASSDSNSPHGDSGPRGSLQLGSRRRSSLHRGSLRRSSIQGVNVRAATKSAPPTFPSQGILKPPTHPAAQTLDTPPISAQPSNDLSDDQEDLSEGDGDALETRDATRSKMPSQTASDFLGESLRADICMPETEEEKLPLSLCGFTLPAFMQKRPPSFNRIATFVVRYAPCFWCTKTNPTGITDRDVLRRLIIICLFFSFGQVASAVVLIILSFAPIADRSTIGGRAETNQLSLNMWSTTGSVILISLLGLAIFGIMIWALRRIKHIQTAGLLRFMWMILWILPLEVFFIVGMLDIHRVSWVYVRHWWYVPSTAWFREKYCRRGTHLSLCTVPICGLPQFGLEAATYPYEETDSPACIDGERSWCIYFFNATNCRDIRDGAQVRTERFLLTYLSLNFVWGLLLAFLLILVIKVLEDIITKPIVQRSREANMPGWLTLPIVWSLVAGLLLIFGQDSALSQEAKQEWLSYTFIIVGGLFFLSAVWGWFLSAFTILNNSDKQIKRIGALNFIFTLVLTLLGNLVIFAASITYILILEERGLSTDDRGTAACSIDTTDSCSFCDTRQGGIGLVECPEWSTSEVTRIIRTQLKASLALSVIFMVYALSALRFGFLLLRHINQYQLDYV